MLSVSSVSFSVWEPHSILESSVIAVENEADLSSPLLGVVFDGKCPTCFETKHKCPGHWGSIRLAEPMYHISWIPHLMRLLKKVEGKFVWDKQGATLRRDGEIFPRTAASRCSTTLPSSRCSPSSSSVRPALFVDGVLRGENDLTYRLQNIVRRNKSLWSSSAASALPR